MNSGLPVLTASGVSINGQTQAGEADNGAGPEVEVRAAVSSFTDVFTISGSNNTIEGLAINKYGSGNGKLGSLINILGGQGNMVRSCYIGTSASGCQAAPLASDTGIYIANGANNIIGAAGFGNVISANGLYGICVAAGQSNKIAGNFIGTDPTGSIDLGNTYYGIWLYDGANTNKIGGENPGEGNVISGNDNLGVYISGSGSNSNEVYGNIIGLDQTGRFDLGNNQEGVSVYNGASYNLIGNGQSAGRNIISGNNRYGVAIGADGNVVAGNYIGKAIDGLSSIGNDWGGVSLYSAAKHNRICAGNVISGNNEAGVSIVGNGVNSNEVNGNTIIGNSGDGVNVRQGAKYNRIGGVGNVVVNNGRNGIYLVDPGTNYNEISNNFIGIDAVSAEAGNGWFGVYIDNKAGANIIGSANVIAYNGDFMHPAGICLNSSQVTQELISRNSIYENYGRGILLLNGANNMIPAPVISAASYNQPTGELALTVAASPNAQVEIFKARGGQGECYLWSFAASSSGEVNSLITYPGLLAGDTLVATQRDTWQNSSEFSPAQTVNITVPFVYQPEVKIGTTGVDYAVDRATLTVTSKETAVFYFLLKNTGNVADQYHFLVSGPGSEHSLRIFDAKSGGNEITAVLQAGGYSCSLPLGGEMEGRIEINCLSDHTITSETILIVNSINDPGKIDQINAKSTFVFPDPPAPLTVVYSESDLGMPGTSISIPGDAMVHIPVISIVETESPGSPPAGYQLGGKVLSVVSSVKAFSRPITMTVPINGLLSAPRVFYWGPGGWSCEGIEITSATSRSITFNVSHFSILAPMGALSSNLVRIGPNPYNPNGGTPAKIWYWLDAAAATSVYIVDLSGAVVWQRSFTAGAPGGSVGENNLDFDGKDKWGQVLGDGVYLYKIVQGGKVIGGGKMGIVK
ncbi:hypothetical protein A3K48_07010 [candidate division WOR-1 bacterium RIFOXYA12_FULL_52_29]|uniref:Right handed beta helix domain-containing protein n=1 Tax=candidate division WOR-1 bacterium RIFOXYC12_FULL_54_18 TaxID=1802584 RepID=A0A1F4T7R3_UNCSA|nr:MAG: hypothetical protein A3K44_07010 [candidate division WOR-1 bacterium RIFOXYA2_FULL_51_19]OGC18269.1 MAG: hypothetical protein A3K48_07010 [candidate division WOR-1 bacterium RIFOXYA12_FULL_52_29]OGC27124.1 MAG: hypothetical protein A3K32_07005 [candidate division WOR-1 bacterium RIFOXYB2_FULL_45_9]OGC28686.1 MAG: hypothetical protein A3K49_07010 [candidate division WOR-1 bacterium RIFOXYC12_FULL_54_18]OGC30859.1 MAG: hypothetical protein A2346_05610 [candidate division WOR-1 bacterium R